MRALPQRRPGRRTLLAAAASLWPAMARAQGGQRVYRIGVLDWFSPSDRVVYDGLVAALRELGYEDGRNIAIVYRGADGDPERAARDAAELAHGPFDVIVAIATAPAHAAKSATRSIPIVFNVADPLATGLVANLARPGGNLTGLSNSSTDVAAKWLELLRDLLPGLDQVTFLGSSRDPNGGTFLQAIESSAGQLGIAVRPLLIADDADLAAPLEAGAAARSSALVVQPVLLNRRVEIGERARRLRLPWISERRNAAEAGAVLAYGANRPALYRRFAGYVDRVLRGANPGELPISSARSKIDAGSARSSSRAARRLTFLGGEMQRIVALSARYRLPTMLYNRVHVEAGGLMSYGVDPAFTYRQGGAYAARILAGARPATLPVLQPTSFELVINLRTARALGLAVPPTLLARADQVIE
jgi:putative ABC transport system substrate-binding protein